MSIAKKLMVVVLLVSGSMFGGKNDKLDHLVKAFDKGLDKPIQECLETTSKFCGLIAVTTYCCGCTTAACCTGVIATGAHVVNSNIKAAQKTITQQPK